MAPQETEVRPGHLHVTDSEPLARGKRTNVRFYFSFRSPYSWLAARYVEERGGGKDEPIDYIPFWEPDARSLELLHARGGEWLYTPMSRAKHLYILQDIKRLVASRGYAMAWPVDIDPWWEVPHLAYIAARKEGKGHDFFWAVYRARWEEGRNICSPEVIRALARECDLDADGIAAAVDDPQVREEGAAALLACYRDEVFGVPYFVVGRERFWGVDRVSAFVERLLGGHVRRDSRAAEAAHAVASGAPYDTDHAGGCG